MTKIQQAIYDFIVEYTTDNLYPPTMEEIAQAVGRRRWAVHTHLKALDNLGVIEMPFHMGARTIHLVGYKLVKESE